MRNIERLGTLSYGLFLAAMVLSPAVAADDPRRTDPAPAGDAVRAVASPSKRDSGPVRPQGAVLNGISVTESGGTTDINEGGAGDSYTLVLQSAPTQPVTVNLTFDASQLVVNGDSDGSLGLVFTATDWFESQTVTVVAVDDTVVESVHASTIVQTTSSADPVYGSIDPADVTVSIDDNDTAEVIFSSAGFSAIEGAVIAPGATLKVTANGSPGGNVASAIVVLPSMGFGSAEAADVSVSGSFIFPAGSTHDTVILSASFTVADDRLVEATETFSLSYSIVSGPATTTASNDYEILSDDSAAIGFAAPSSATLESVGAAVVPVVLTVSGAGSGPAGLGEDVSVAVLETAGSATTPADYQLSTPALTFAAGAASGESRNVQVAVVGDALIEGNHGLTLGFGSITSAAGSVSAAGTHALTLLDDDVAGVSISEPGGNTVTEGGAGDSFTLALTAQPSSDVTITFDVGTQVTFAPNPLVITPAQWNVGQAITISAVDDVLIEGPHGATVGLIFTGDANFASITPNSIGVSVSIADNDVPGVVVTESDGTSSATEGGTGDTYTIQLASAPTADVSIAIDAGTQVAVNATLLTFTPLNYNVAQTVVLSAVDDALVEGAHGGNVSHTATSADANYDGIAVAPVGVALGDNDSAGVTIIALGGDTTTAEGGAGDSITLQLTAEPTADVTITFDVGTQVTFAPNPLVITAAQWNVPQAVTVAAVDDTAIEGPHGATVGLDFSGDADFAAIPPGSIAVPVSITDNDAAGVIVVASGGSTEVGEGGPTDGITLQLTAQPASDVSISFDVGTQLTFAPNPLVITPAQWNVPQAVTVTAVDDALAQGTRSVDVGLGFGGDADFAAIPAGSVAVAVTVSDDDSPGILLLQSDGSSQVSEAGAGDDYTLQLLSQPSADVQITLDDGSQLLVSPMVLTFTAANWNLPQMVSITALDDAQTEGAHAGSVSHVVTSADPDYDGLAVAALPVGIGDDDLLVSPQPIPVDRGVALLLLVLLVGLGGSIGLARRSE